MMQDKLKPAILGGVLLGLLSAIPFIKFLNSCCCLWAILGGMLTSYLYLKNATSPVSKSAADGATLGGIAGLTGGFINFVIGVPLALITDKAVWGILAQMVASIDPADTAGFRERAAQSQTIYQMVLSGVLTSLLLVVFATIGGVLGMVLLGRNKNPPPSDPSPPTSQLPGYYPPTGASGNYGR